MKIHYMVPYSVERNLGKAYNEAMSLIPDGDSACFKDGDAMYTVPDWGHIIHGYAVRNPEAVLTCWITNIHPLASGQKHYADNHNIKDVLEAAQVVRMNCYDTTPITGSVSGTLMVIPKSIWKMFPFTESNVYRPGQPNLLGVDNDFTNRIRKAGIPVLRMDGLLLYHQYRLLTGTKEHLL